MTDDPQDQACQWLLTAAALPILVTDAAGLIVLSNPAAQKLFGYTEAELKGLAVEALIPERYRGGHRQAYAGYAHAPHIRELSAARALHGLRRDGSEFDVEIGLDPIGDGLVVATIQDVSERRRTEAALRESEARLKLFIEHAPAALAMFDRDMRYLAASRRWVEDYSLGGQDIIGRSHYEIFPEIPERWKTAHRRGLSGEVVQIEEDRFERADGSVQWLHWVIRPWHAAEGEVGGIVIFTEDISERKRAELALSEREAQYRGVIETASDGFWMIDEEGRLLAVNDAYVRRSGYSREELLNMRIENLEAQESPEEVRAHMEKVRREGSDLFETRHRTKDGEVWPAEVNASYWADAGGRFFGFVRDITERKRGEATRKTLQAEMEQVMRFHVASQTVSALAHELNQPLNAVTSYAEAALRLLRAGNPQPERLQHALESSAQQAQRAGRVVRELLAFLRQGEVQTKPVNLNEVVHRVLDRIDAEGHGGFQVRLELDPALAHVGANRLQVEKVLANLIQNGAEAMHAAGINTRSITITVRTHADGGMAQVTVADSGPGIDEQTRHRIFDPFFTTKPKGLGMGLAISRAIIEGHGGQLWVESEPGAGASFHFTLPFAP